MDEARTASIVRAAERQAAAMVATEQAAAKQARTMGLLEAEAAAMNAEFDASSSVFGRFAKSLDATTVVLGAFVAAGLIVHKFVTETEAAQDAQAQLEAAVRSTGAAAGRSVDQLQALATQLQSVSTYSDEAVQGAESILLTFTKIKGDNFDDATRAVVDLATRMGGDLKGAALQLGKALQDPAEGLSALRRSGVSFSEGQQQVIKDLNATGHAADAQRLILAELEKEFGGSAAAARDTLGGALKGLSNSFGDLFEISKTNSQGVIDAINGLSVAFEHLNDSISGGDFLASEIKGFTRMIEVINAAGQSFGDLAAIANAAGLTMRGVLSGNLDTVQRGAKETNDALADLAATGKHLHDVLSAPIAQGLFAQTGIASKVSLFGTSDADDAQKVTDAYKKAVAAAEVAIQKQNALNDAFGATPAFIAELNAAFELKAKIAAIDAEYTGKQRDVLESLANKLYDAEVATRALAKAEADQTFARDAALSATRTDIAARTNPQATATGGSISATINGVEHLVTISTSYNALLSTQQKLLNGQVIDTAAIGKNFNDANKPLAEASGHIITIHNDTTNWLSDLQTVVGVVQLVASAFGDVGKSIAAAATGTQSIIAGLNAAKSLKDAQGNTTSLSTALSGSAGGAAQLGSLGSIGAIAGGILALGNALGSLDHSQQNAQKHADDLASAYTRQVAAMEKAIQAATDSTTAIQNDTAARDAQARAVLAAELKAARGDSDKVGAAFQQYQDAINATGNAAAARVKDLVAFATSLQQAGEDLSVRYLRATGQGSQADLTAFDETSSNAKLQTAHDKYQSAAYDAQLATTQLAERISFLADRAKAAAAQAETDRRASFDLTNRRPRLHRSTRRV